MGYGNLSIPPSFIFRFWVLPYKAQYHDDNYYVGIKDFIDEGIYTYEILHLFGEYDMYDFDNEIKYQTQNEIGWIS